MNPTTHLSIRESTLLICPRCGARNVGLVGRGCPICPSAMVACQVANTLSGDPDLGRVLDGQYALVDRLSTGGLSVMYCGVRVPQHRPVVVKIEQRVESESLKQALSRCLTREIELLQSLEHHALPRLLDVFYDKERICMVVDHPEETTLEHHLLDLGPRLTPQEALRITSALLEIVDGLHNLGLVHRNLSASGISIGGTHEKPRLRLLDLGRACFNDAAELSHTRHETLVQTQRGLLLGTLQYFSPEQLLGERGDHRADIYAIGVLLHRMLTGGFPFKASVRLSDLQHRVSSPPPSLPSPLSRHHPLNALVMQALALNPEDRFQSAAEMAEVTDRVLSRLTHPPRHAQETNEVHMSKVMDQLRAQGIELNGQAAHSEQRHTDGDGIAQLVASLDENTQTCLQPHHQPPHQPLMSRAMRWLNTRLGS